MALFAVNTGCRDAITCGLRWEWEIQLTELNTSVFLVPKEFMKNRRDHVIVLNDIARQIVEDRRGVNPEFVFTYQNKCISRMSNNGWQRARKDADMEHVRIHDLRHTFGSRLRAAGVSVEDREDLLGHKSNRMTTHYSAAQLSNLLKAVNKVSEQNGQMPTLTMLRKNKVTYLHKHRRDDLAKSRKSPAEEIFGKMKTG
jgi:integrase